MFLSISNSKDDWPTVARYSCYAAFEFLRQFASRCSYHFSKKKKKKMYNDFEIAHKTCSVLVWVLFLLGCISLLHTDVTLIPILYYALVPVVMDYLSVHCCFLMQSFMNVSMSQLSCIQLAQNIFFV